MSNDLQTESTPIRSSCILSGQELPTGESALFTRIILLSFDSGKHRDDKQKTAFDKLKNIEINGGFPYITSEICQYRELVEKNFESTYKEIEFGLKRKLIDPVIDDRFIENISILLAFRKIFNGVLDFDFTYEEAEAFIIENINHHQILKTGNDDVSKFWQVVESLFHQNIILEGRDYILQDGFIYIRIQQVHPFYVKEMIARRDMNHLAIATLKHYLELDKQVFGGSLKKRFPDGTNTWTYKMKYDKLGIDLIKINAEGLTPDQKEQAIKMKYREMGVDYGEEVAEQMDAFVQIEGEGF